MTLEEALERIIFLEPYYTKYNEKSAECDNWKAERDVWQKQCLDMNTQLQPPDPPKIIGTLTSDNIISICTENFPDIWTDLNRYLKLYDGTYQLTTMDEIRRFVKWDRTNLMLYIWELLDCDDFAAHLWGDFACTGWSGLPVAMVVSDLYGGHVFCAVIACESEDDKTPRMYFIEPQDDLEIAPEIIAGHRAWGIVFH